MQPLLQPFPFPRGCRAQAWRYQPQYRRPLHFHAEPELNFVWRGRARFVVGNRSFWVERGGLLILPPGVDHALVEASADLEFFAIGFQPELVNAYARTTDTDFGFRVACKQVSDGLTERLASMCGTLGEAPDRLVVEGLLREPLEHAALDAIDAGPSTPPPVGARAASLLLNEGSLRRYEIAKALASNNGDISRSFLRDEGIPLREFRRRIRVLRFLEAAAAYPKNLTRAAHAAGFGSYSQCHRDFSALLGMAPRAFLTSGRRQAMADHFEPALPNG
ncbi:MAG TPA: AraC family transcriptional regulator [Polyangiaceae bacterium]